MVKNILKIEKIPDFCISLCCVSTSWNQQIFDVLKFISKHQRMILKHFFNLFDLLTSFRCLGVYPGGARPGV